MAFYPSPIVIPDEYVELVGAAYERSAITPSDANALLKVHYPRCAAHHVPCDVIYHGQPLCVRCVEALHTPPTLPPA